MTWSPRAWAASPASWSSRTWWTSCCFFVNPTIQGAGERPFDGAAVDLELLEARGFDSGVALLRYRPHLTGGAR